MTVATLSRQDTFGDYLTNCMLESGQTVLHVFSQFIGLRGEISPPARSTYKFRINEEQAAQRDRVKGREAPAAIPVAANDPWTTGDLARELRTAGMPIAGIAEMARVERKTVYSWIDNDAVEASSANARRMSQIHALLKDEATGSLRFIHRFWNRELPGGSLHSLLISSSIDEVEVRCALDALRPAVTRALAKEIARPVSISAAAGLSEYVETTFN